MGFKERMGFVAPRVAIQDSELDEETRVALYNALHSVIEALRVEYQSRPGDGASTLMSMLWADYFKRPMDDFPGARFTIPEVKDEILDGEWFDVLELLEEAGRCLRSVASAPIAKGYFDILNAVFSRYLVGYRFVSAEVVPVTSELETAAIEDAIEIGGTVAVHLQRAVQLLSDRERPQYAKVVHEAISAVEAKVGDMTGKRVLSEGLKELEKLGFHTHPALRDGWIKFYGYSSDAGGIRHALVRDEDIDEPLAVYFLVSCSAFVNLLTKIESAKSA